MSYQGLTKSELARYAAIALPLSFAGLPLYIHVPDFYARDFGIDLGLLGITLLAIRLFDAIQDPLIGFLSDRYSQSRYRIMMLGGMCLLLGMAGLFYGPQAGVSVAAWFALLMVLATTGFSIMTINVTMLGGFWREKERAKISAWREGFALLGLLLAAILPTALQSEFSSQNSFIIFFWLFCVLLLGCGVLFGLFTRHFSPSSTSELSADSFSFLTILKGADKTFFSVCFLSHLAASIPAALVLFFIRDYLNAEDVSGLFLLLYFVSGALFIGSWVKLSNAIGIYKAWLLAMLLAVFTFIGAYTLDEGELIFYGLICVLSGISLGADLALPPAIMAMRIQHKKSESQATQHYAIIAFLPKVAIALAAGSALVILDIWGFETASSNSTEALTVLITLYALVPCVIKLLAAGLLYRLIQQEGHDHENNQRSVTHGTHNVS